ncbi:hypothetical protein J2T18_003842 [Paenibacillus polymyxa]|nr:hypothetical protein [Paenibacillus polymyxa]
MLYLLLSASTSRAMLLLNNDRIIILFLNLFSSKVVEKVEFEVADLQEQKYHSSWLYAKEFSKFLATKYLKLATE